MTEERLEVKLKRITDKCEQYWNGPRVDAPELHAILGFIHQEASGVVSAHASDLARMRRALVNARLYAVMACGLNAKAVDWPEVVKEMEEALGPAEQAGEVAVEYEIVNPSDKAFVSGNDWEAVCLSVLVVGAGKYGITGAKDMPVFYFGGHDEWFQEQFGRTFAESIEHVGRKKIAEALASFRLASERSSMNDFVGYAHKKAKELLEDAPDARE